MVPFLIVTLLLCMSLVRGQDNPTSAPSAPPSSQPSSTPTSAPTPLRCWYGQYLDLDTMQCVKCPVDFYSASTDGCHQCPEGKSTNGDTGNYACYKIEEKSKGPFTLDVLIIFGIILVGLPAFLGYKAWSKKKEEAAAEEHNKRGRERGRKHKENLEMQRLEESQATAMEKKRKEEAEALEAGAGDGSVISDSGTASVADGDNPPAVQSPLREHAI